ncbi:hypothetical protein ACE6H2_023543 [Prunus campanulata]
MENAIRRRFQLSIQRPLVVYNNAPNVAFVGWQGSHIDPRLTIGRAIQNCGEFLDAKAKSHVPFGDASDDQNMIAQGWGPSMSNYVKINFDGAWKKDSHFAGLGVVARDAIGSFCGGLATSFHCNSALVLEAAAGPRGGCWPLRNQIFSKS